MSASHLSAVEIALVLHGGHLRLPDLVSESDSVFLELVFPAL
jgi:hypothetical protein